MEEDAFFSQATEATDETEAAYYKRQIDQARPDEAYLIEGFAKEVSSTIYRVPVLPRETLATRHGTHIPFSLVPILSKHYLEYCTNH